MQLRGILLDVDGTLVDSNQAHAEAWSAASTEFGFERPPDFFRPLIGMGGDHVLPRIDPSLNDESEPGKSMAARRGVLFKERWLATLRPTPGARALVERFRELGLRTIVATSAKAEDLEALLEVARAGDLIDVRTTTDDAENSKPAPDIVHSAMTKANVSSDEVIMIGDTPHDIMAATQAGVPTIAFRCGGWQDHDLKGAVAIYDDPADLLRNFETSPLARGREERAT